MVELDWSSLFSNSRPSFWWVARGVPPVPCAPFLSNLTRIGSRNDKLLTSFYFSYKI